LSPSPLEKIEEIEETLVPLREWQYRSLMSADNPEEESRSEKILLISKSAEHITLKPKKCILVSPGVKFTAFTKKLLGNFFLSK
jgi:hypothetical protein